MPAQFLVLMNEASLTVLSESDRCTAAVEHFWGEYRGKWIGGGPKVSTYESSLGTKRAVLGVQNEMIAGAWGLVV